MEFKTEDQIFIEMAADAENRGLIKTSNDLINDIIQRKNIENQYLLDLATHAKQLNDIERKLENIYINTDIDTATGDALDIIGKLFNINRLQAAPATIEITITNPATSDNNIIIPAGTKLIIDNIVSDEPYYMAEAATIPAGVESVTATVESENYIYHVPVPAGSLMQLEGFNNLNVSNANDGTTGRNIEEDTPYRERIKKWYLIYTRGSRECIENRLTANNLIKHYNIIPLYDGVGTLKIIADTTPAELENIPTDIYNNCMYSTDAPPLCIAPTDYIITELNLNIKIRDTTRTNGEIRQLIEAQTRAHISGGYKNDGSYNKGLNIGEPLIISQLIQYLLNEVPEVYSITSDADEITTIEPDEKIKIYSIVVTITGDN